MNYLLYRIWKVLPASVQWPLKWLVVPKFLVGALAVILNSEGNVLLVHHTYRRKHPWGLPGGWLQARETPLAAINREIREETSYTIEIEDLLFVWCAKDRSHLTFVYLGNELQGTFKATEEVSKVDFFELSRLPKLLEPSQVEFYSQLMEALKSRELIPKKGGSI